MANNFSPSLSPREQIRRLCRDRGEDFATLSRLVGRNPAYIQQFVARGTPRLLPERERAILARHFDIPEYLLGGDETRSAVAGLVPLFERGQADTQARLGLDAATVARLSESGAALIELIEMEGEAMAPTLRPGDQLLIDRGDGPKRLRDGLYLIRIEGRDVVKRLTLHPLKPKVTVQSDNPDHADWPDLPRAKLTVIGRAIWLARALS